jgi:hypothetical protein
MAILGQKLTFVIPGQCAALNPEPMGKRTALHPLGFGFFAYREAPE